MSAPQPPAPHQMQLLIWESDVSNDTTAAGESRATLVARKPLSRMSVATRPDSLDGLIEHVESWAWRLLPLPVAGPPLGSILVSGTLTDGAIPIIFPPLRPADKRSGSHCYPLGRYGRDRGGDLLRGVATAIPQCCNGGAGSRKTGVSLR